MMPKHLLPLLAIAACLTACGDIKVEQDYPDISPGATEEGGSILDYFKFNGVKIETAETETQTQPAAPNAPAVRSLAVNADLWRAALDTVRFMPLAAADPVGGTVITDWYNDPGTPGERVKINIVISSLELRADALRVSIFREKRSGNRYVSVAASQRAERQMENIILTRARDYKIARGGR